MSLLASPDSSPANAHVSCRRRAAEVCTKGSKRLRPSAPRARSRADRAVLGRDGEDAVSRTRGVGTSAPPPAQEIDDGRRGRVEGSLHCMRISRCCTPPDSRKCSIAWLRCWCGSSTSHGAALARRVVVSGESGRMGRRRFVGYAYVLHLLLLLSLTSGPLPFPPLPPLATFR